MAPGDIALVKADEPPMLDERVAETVVVRRVEHLEQDGGRRRAELVDLVEHADRVPAAEPRHLAQDRAGLRVLPRAVVATQVRLVVQCAPSRDSRLQSQGAMSSIPADAGWASPALCPYSGLDKSAFAV